MKTFFIGIDVSKPFFDVSVMPVVDHAKEAIVTSQFENTLKGLSCFKKWLIEHGVCFDKNSLVVIENTGIYHRLLWAFCSKEQLPIHIGNAAHIKWSFGIARGKNDMIDSIRLCTYAYKHHDDLKPTRTLSQELVDLKDLMTARTRLLKQITSMKTFLRELRGVNSPSTQNALEKAHEQALKGMQASLAKIEAMLEKKVEENEAVKTNYRLVKSVPGIGHLTAIYLICCTHNFTQVKSGKQLACYAGVVPFEHSSGISVRGRARVHPMANKELKRMLHLCAMSAKNNNTEFNAYYDKKKKEGKHSMCVLNAIRNKLVLRVAAVIRNQTAYESNLQMVA